MSNIGKIRQEIERFKNDYLNRSYTFVPAVMQQLLEFIDSLPDENLSNNLDEEAEEYAWKKEQPLSDGERLSIYFNPRIDAFKSGARWMAEQGVSVNAISSTEEDGITEEGMKLISNYLESLPDKTEVVLQIRKKQ